MITLDNVRISKLVVTSLFSGDTVFIEEMLQNAQRAGAKSIWFDTDGKVLSIRNDGPVCSDLTVVTQMGTTGWDLPDENPFGLGFFSLAAMCQRVVVRSGINSLMIDFDELKKGNLDCDIKNTCAPVKGFRVDCYEVTIRNYILEYELKRACLFSPLKVHLDGQLLRTDCQFGDLSLGDFHAKFGNGYIGASIDSYATECDLAYGIHVYNKGRYVANLNLPYVCGILHDPPVDLRAPDRKAIIRNARYEAFEKTLREAIRTLDFDHKYGRFASEYFTDDELRSRFKFRIIGCKKTLDEFIGPSSPVSVESGTISGKTSVPLLVGTYQTISNLNMEKVTWCDEDFALNNGHIIEGLIEMGYQVIICPTPRLEHLFNGVLHARQGRELLAHTLKAEDVSIEDGPEAEMSLWVENLTGAQIMFSKMNCRALCYHGNVVLSRPLKYDRLIPNLIERAADLGHELAHIGGRLDNTVSHLRTAEDYTTSLLAEIAKYEQATVD